MMLRVFKCLGHLPLLGLHGLGWVGGWLVWLLAPVYRRRWFEHTAQAGLRGGQRWASVGEAGRQVAELPRLWFGPPPTVGWQGAAHLEAALRQHQGLVLLTPHLGCFEVTAQAYAQRFGVDAELPRPVTVMFRPPRQASLLPVLEAARNRPGVATAPATLAGVRRLLQALRQGGAVGLLPDQVPPDGMGVWAPFFGRPAYTMTLALRFARLPDTQVLFVWGERLPWGRGYVVHVRPWNELVGAPLAPDDATAAGQINLAMERLIMACPAQYAWGYARYKPPR